MKIFFLNETLHPNGLIYSRSSRSLDLWPPRLHKQTITYGSCLECTSEQLAEQLLDLQAFGFIISAELSGGFPEFTLVRGGNKKTDQS